jgi:hypothetical protein
MCDGGGSNFIFRHNGPQSLQAGSGSIVYCDKGVPQVIELIHPSVANVDQVLIDLLDNLNGLKYTNNLLIYRLKNLCFTSPIVRSRMTLVILANSAATRLKMVVASACTKLNPSFFSKAHILKSSELSKLKSDQIVLIKYACLKFVESCREVLNMLQQIDKVKVDKFAVRICPRRSTITVRSSKIPVNTASMLAKDWSIAASAAARSSALI